MQNKTEWSTSKAKQNRKVLYKRAKKEKVKMHFKFLEIIKRTLIKKDKYSRVKLAKEHKGIILCINIKKIQNKAIEIN
jgi:hypothetical protein